MTDCRRPDHQQHADEELSAKGKTWLGYAAAAITAFVAFSGEYKGMGVSEFVYGYEYDDDM